MQSIRNFSILNAAFIAAAATNATARAKFKNDSPDVMFYNPNAFIVYVAAGDLNVVATTRSMPILPGEKGVYSKGGHASQSTHFAYITDGVDAGDLEYSEGEGT